MGIGIDIDIDIDIVGTSAEAGITHLLPRPMSGNDEFFSACVTVASLSTNYADRTAGPHVVQPWAIRLAR